MVQMKALLHGQSIWTDAQLYIPHGSDERVYCERYEKDCFIFISHMVQMKGVFFVLVIHLYIYFISHMVQMKEREQG